MLWGVPALKNTPNWTFDFQKRRGALGVGQIKKLHITKSDWGPIIMGVPFGARLYQKVALNQK